MATTLHTLTIDGVAVPVIYEEQRSLPIVAMQLIFQGAGSSADAEPGTAKMLSKLLGEGSKTLGSVGFAKALEDKAITLQTGNSSETMVMELSSLKESFSAGLLLAADLLSNPNETPSTLRKIKTMTRTQLLRKEDDFDYLADTALRETLFAGSPLGRPQLGTLAGLDKLTLKTLKTFRQTHLTKQAAIVVIGGDLSLDEALAAAKTLLAPLPKGTPVTRPLYRATETPLTKRILKKETQQAYIYFGAPFNLAINDTEAYKAKVASFILGSSGFGSRLMEEIRVKRGLAYSAYGRVNFNATHNFFSGYLQTKLESEKEAIAVVSEVINRFITEGATQKELEGAQKFLLGSEPLRNETLSQRLSRSFNEYYNGLPLGYTKEELNRIGALSLADLNAFIAAHPEISRLSFSVVTAK